MTPAWDDPNGGQLVALANLRALRADVAKLRATHSDGDGDICLEDEERNVVVDGVLALVNDAIKRELDRGFKISTQSGGSVEALTEMAFLSTWLVMAREQEHTVLDDAVPRLRRAIATWRDAGLVPCGVSPRFGPASCRLPRGHFGTVHISDPLHAGVNGELYAQWTDER